MSWFDFLNFFPHVPVPAPVPVPGVNQVLAWTPSGPVVLDIKELPQASVMQVRTYLTRYTLTSNPGMEHAGVTKETLDYTGPITVDGYVNVPNVMRSSPYGPSTNGYWHTPEGRWLAAVQTVEHTPIILSQETAYDVTSHGGSTGQ